MNLTDPIFTDADKAREYFEGIHWPQGPFCPHCGEAKKVYRLEGKTTRKGLFHCNSCSGQFTVTTGTVMESSKIALNKWALAYWLMNSSKKGISAHQLHRTLGITYKSAWFMAHRIRESMGGNDGSPMGEGGGTVEADETYFQTKKGQKKGRGGMNKRAVVSLVERGATVRSFHAEDMTLKTVGEVLAKNVSPEAHLRTDESKIYKGLGWNFASHETVTHSKDEYVRGDAHTNTIEGYFSIFKRGMKGIYQHCGDRHLHRYLAEFDFRYNNRVALGVDDLMRTMRAIKGAQGKRLTYVQSRPAKAA